MERPISCSGLEQVDEEVSIHYLGLVYAFELLLHFMLFIMIYKQGVILSAPNLTKNEFFVPQMNHIFHTACTTLMTVQ